MLDAFLKSIRQGFDPCFRYMVLARKSSAKEAEAFSDVLGLIETPGPALADQSFLRDPASGVVALVLKLQPDSPLAIVSELVCGRLPDDIDFIIYEPHQRACEDHPEGMKRTDGGNQP